MELDLPGTSLTCTHYAHHALARSWRVVADRVGEGSGAQQLGVRRLCDQGAVQLRGVADLLGQAEPDPLERRPLRRVEFVARPVSINGRVAELERAHAIEPAPPLARQRGPLLRRACRRRLHVPGPGYLGPRRVVLGAPLVLPVGGGVGA